MPWSCVVCHVTENTDYKNDIQNTEDKNDDKNNKINDNFDKQESSNATKKQKNHKKIANIILRELTKA